MAWTQSDLDAVERAIASGERTVSYSDKTVTYRDMDELFKARDAIKQALATTTTPAARQTRLVTKKGW